MKKDIEKVLLTVLTALTVLTLAPVGESAASFLRVADDMDTSAAGKRTSGLTVTDCGVSCFRAGRSECRAFVWRPYVDASFYTRPNATASPEDTAPSLSPLVGSNEEGRCGLMKCVPPPASLTPAPGSQIYLMTGTKALSYGAIMVPASYTMACTFAYRIYDKVLLNYTDAEKQCESDGARLVAIKSSEVQRIMRGRTDSREAYWIGLEDRETEGEFVLSDGTVPKYLNWGSGQPNNYEKDGQDQDCTMLFEGYWNDNQCDQQLRFVCEIPFLEP